MALRVNKFKNIEILMNPQNEPNTPHVALNTEAIPEWCTPEEWAVSYQLVAKDLKPDSEKASLVFRTTG